MKLVYYTIFFIVIIYLIKSLIIEKFKPNDINDTNYVFHDEMKCCKVSKVRNKDKWSYQYQVLDRDDCKKEVTNNYQAILYPGTSYWDSNDKCSKPETQEESYLGSCRRLNFECIDFIPEKACKEIPNTRWSTKTCTDKLLYPITFLPYEVESK